ncbi:TPA: hypothetical protein N0F65_008255 [Lagenidium giganteum]|uniref:Uncharacterized protein n=1 Tax=Lagenidium giganteum TaxID=4803 RepID=A0AAV2YLG2_9STRA|nr:TPA: hypothetical protein N0F65_008255 [Lagenidium giganteum]
MDPMKMLDMQLRTGIGHSDVDEFCSRVDAVTKAMEEIKNGTFDPNNCNIPGFKTPEQEEREQQERAQREAERKQREEERRQKEKQEERETWWQRAKLRFSFDADEASSNQSKHGQDRDTDAQARVDTWRRWGNRTLAAYRARDANDYSVWEKWEPNDPVTAAERAEREAQLEKLRNEEFEKNNPEFCNQFKEDQAKRQESQLSKRTAAEKLKENGNKLYKKKQYETAIKTYMQALEKAPFNEAVLTNIAQSYLRLTKLEDSIEFSSRALFVNPKHVKALSRRAQALYEKNEWELASRDIKQALAIEPGNNDLQEQHARIVGDYEDSQVHARLETQLHESATTANKAPQEANQVLRVAELRFVVELMHKLEESATSEATPPPPTTGDDRHDNQSPPAVSRAWVAYELVLPFFQRNSEVRTMFRTSGELNKLLHRITTALERFDEVMDSSEAVGVLTSMLSCTVAVMVNEPRNHVVSHRDVPFRKILITKFHQLSGSTTAIPMPWSLGQHIVRLVQTIIDTKCWKTSIMAPPHASSTLLQLLRLSEDGATPIESAARRSVVQSAASMCFTLSSDTHDVNHFVDKQRSNVCLVSIYEVLQRVRDAPTRSPELLQDVLGLLTNLSTHEQVRRALEQDAHRAVREALVPALVHIAVETVSASSSISCERALAALLNLTFEDQSCVRQCLLQDGTNVDQVSSLLEHAQKLDVRWRSLVLVFARAVSVICRFHSINPMDASPVVHQLSSDYLLQLLRRLCVLAVQQVTKTTEEAQTDDLWHLSAQIWCHLGWCVKIPSVRAFLRRDGQSLKEMVRLISLINSGAIFTDTKARLVGNMTKVLIAMQNDHDTDDFLVFRRHDTLATLVKALQLLPDGHARKNVAILLAKLCQYDPAIKETVRSLRGIEIMLSVSRSLQTSSI